MSWDWVTVLKNLNWTLIFNLINFALLLWLLKRLLYRPMLVWLEKRRKLEEERINRAKALEAEAEALVQKRNEELKLAKERAQRILAEAEMEARAILQKAKQEARLSAQLILKDGEEAASRLVEETLAELRRAYAELVVLGAARILEREVRPEDHTRLLSELTSRIDARLLS